jgi:hypothetical protein
VICIGSSIRAALLWAQSMAALNKWNALEGWLGTWPIFGTSVIFNTAGSLACIWMLTPRRWRVCLTFGTLALAIVFPIATYYLL